MISKASVGDASELKWFKSSYSDSSSGNDCVEVAADPCAIHVRDSKNAQGPRLAFGPGAWANFVSYASDN